MIEEKVLRSRRHDLLQSIEYSNEIISKRFEEIEEQKTKIREYKIELKVIDQVLGDE